MQKKKHGWILAVLRYGLCVAAVVYLVQHVNWYDRVHLKDDPGHPYRLLDRRGETLVVQRGSEPSRDITMDDVQFRDMEDGVTEPVPNIEPGLGGVARQIDVKYAVLAVLIFFPVPIIQSVRLVWMLAIQEVKLTYWDAIKLTYAGNFFNFALPGTTGGDLFKAYYITRYTHRKTEAVTTVFLDRVVGLLGLMILAGTMIMVTWDSQRYGSLALVIAFVSLGLAVGALLVFSKRLRHMIRLPQIAAMLPAGEQLLRVGRATVAMRQHKGLVGAALLNTMVLQFIVMVSAYVMALALGMSGSFAVYLVYVPIGFLIVALPISPPQGFGVMEYFYTQFFAASALGNTPSQAVAFALAVRVIQLVWAIPGVLVPLLGAHLPKAAELESLKTTEPNGGQEGGLDDRPVPTT